MEVDRLQNSNGVEDRRNAALVVCDSRSIGTIPLDPKRSCSKCAIGIDRIHVGHKHDLTGAGSLKAPNDDLTQVLRRVKEPIGLDLGCFVILDMCTKRSQPLTNISRNAVEPFLVPAAGLNIHKLSQRLHDGRTFALNEGPNRFNGCRRRMVGKTHHERKKDHSG